MTITPRQHAYAARRRDEAETVGAVICTTGYRPVHASVSHRKGRDYYATPTWVTEALLGHIRFRAPAMGTMLWRWRDLCDGCFASHHNISTYIAECGFMYPCFILLALSECSR